MTRPIPTTDAAADFVHDWRRIAEALRAQPDGPVADALIDAQLLAMDCVAAARPETPRGAALMLEAILEDDRGSFADVNHVRVIENVIAGLRAMDRPS